MRAGRRDEAFRRLRARLAFARGYLAARYGCELGGDPGIDELLHEAAARALERIADYDPARGELDYWLWSIALHRAADRLASERARKHRERAAARPEACADSRLARDLREAIEGLEEPYRTVLLLDLEHDGRAPMRILTTTLGAAPQTLYNWRVAARKALRERLQ